MSSVLLGKLSAQGNMFSHFVRIHQMIGTESLFNITALQIYRLLEEVPADKILVVVGGSSRFNGAGQRPQEIWTRHLQTRLGDRYAVVNLALRAGTSDQGGAHAAEAMIKAGRRVIFLADWTAHRTIPPGAQARYWYLFYDWLARDLLLESEFRDRRLAEFESYTQEIDLRELRLRSRFDRWLYFDELWTYVAYRYVSFAVWQSLTRLDPFAPRSALADPEEVLPDDCCYRYRDFERGLRTAQDFASSEFAKKYFSDIEEWGRMMPIELRRRSLIVPIALSPFYTEHLSPPELAQYAANITGAVEVLGRSGFRGFAVGQDFKSDDFIDVFHISESGGRKLADVIAPRIEQMSRDLEYVQ